MSSSALRFLSVLALVGLHFEGLPAVEYFFDDFEGYVDDLGLVEDGGWMPVDVNTPVENATWTVMNPGGRAFPPTDNGRPSEGIFLISDSDKAGGDNPTGSGMSHDIWSPVFSCVGATAVWLHLDTSAQLNNNGVCVFDIDVTTNEGADWTNVFRSVAPGRGVPPLPTTGNADGVFGLLHVDLSAQAAGKPDVRFRLRHFEPNDDWWIAVDNVIVDDQPPGNGATNLLLETFDGGIPDTWTVRSDATPPNTGASTWNTEDTCKRILVNFNGGTFPDGVDGRRLHRLDGKSAIMESGCAAEAAEDEYLITPAFNCTNATDVFLHFKSNCLVDSSTQEVLLSLDGGETFEAEPIFSYVLGGLMASGEEPFFAERTFEIPAAVGESEVAFAFHFRGPGEDAAWGIDDVRVSANGTGFEQRTCQNRQFAVSAYDPAAGSISMTWKTIPGDEGFSILANGAPIGATLAAGTTSFTHTSPPPGSAITYRLQSRKAGSVELECEAPPVNTFTCVSDLSCCADQGLKTVRLTWTPGSNLGGAGYKVLRDGATIQSAVPFTANTFTDTVGGPGTYLYELALDGGDPAQCPGLSLECTAVFVGGDAIFYDDFDCYTTDADLTAAGWAIHEENSPVEMAAWTIRNPGGRDNPPLRDGRPSKGKFLVSDSDNASGENPTGTGISHDIWSPVLDATGRTEVWIHMDASLVLNNNGKAVFDVDVSVDGGANWVNVFRRVAPGRTEAEPLPLADIPEGFEGGPQVGNADGFFGPLDVDISAVAAGRPSFRFRLRQFEPNDDWWVAVDNVLVDTKPVRGGSRVLLDTEDFSGGIPDTWFVDSLDGIAPWMVADPCLISLLLSNGGLFPDSFDGRGLHHLDDSFAMVSADEFCATRAGDETLSTPTIDASDAAEVFLHFKSGIIPSDAIQEVLLSIDNGVTFDRANPIFSYNLGAGMLRDDESVYNELILSVPRAAGESQVVFGFHYLNSSQRTSYWAIDDVQVTAEGPAGGVFHRGDSDQNGNVELTDAIQVLGFLFLGSETRVPECRDAADADDNGEIQLTDAVRILGYLFLGGPAPPAPGPTSSPCGPDPSEDSLDCASYSACE